MIAYIDVDTQLDFVFPAGALYVPGSEALVDRIAALNRHAAAHGIPLLSTVDAHAENDHEFRAWPPHCVVGTNGQSKPAATLLDKRVNVPSYTAAFVKAPQMLIEKQTTDCFTNENLRPLLDELGISECVVYGVVTEICVKNAVKGLLATGRKVQVVADAVASLNTAEAREFLSQVPTINATQATS